MTAGPAPDEPGAARPQGERPAGPAGAVGDEAEPPEAATRPAEPEEEVGAAGPVAAALARRQQAVLEATSGRVVVAVGVDVVEVDRVRTALARTEGFADRVFTPAEQAWADRAADPSERLALRWAVKEAVMKALGAGVGTLAFTTIEVVRADSGEIGVVLHGAARQLASRRGVASLLVSGTHAAGLADAVALALADTGPAPGTGAPAVCG